MCYFFFFFPFLDKAKEVIWGRCFRYQAAFSRECFSLVEECKGGRGCVVDAMVLEIWDEGGDEGAGIGGRGMEGCW